VATLIAWKSWWAAGLLLASTAAHASLPARAQIDARNAAWTDAAAAGDLATLGRHYSHDATLMPEHARVRRGNVAIQAYLQQWWQQARVTRWERQAQSVDAAGDHLIEIGRYAQRLEREGRAPFDYAGKYLAIWRPSADGLQVVAELWGADAPFDRADLPESALPAGNTAAVDDADASIQRALAGRNALITTLVRERRGAEHAALFVDDAAYLTYYTPPLRGMDAIRAYFVEHERPGPVSIESIAIDSDGLRTLAANALYLEEGRYRVGWRAGGDSGVVEGKSLNIWQRGDDGQWRLFRQAVNHD
jgi:ketosteroid isomerase-like protein